MKKGKIYKEINSTHNLVVMCIRPYVDTFEGVIIGSKQLDLIGVYSSLFNVKKFTEYIGPFNINNVLIDCITNNN